MGGGSELLEHLLLLQIGEAAAEEAVVLAQPLENFSVDPEALAL
jgi:hypothetical protein